SVHAPSRSTSRRTSPPSPRESAREAAVAWRAIVDTGAIDPLPGRYRLASSCLLDFRILGPLEVLDGDRPVRLGGPKPRATLAILLLNANRVVSVERLADDLYA